MINLNINFSDFTGVAGVTAQNSQPSALNAQSFTAMLSEAISETLSQFGINPNAITLSVDNQPSQSNATSQSSAAAPVIAPVATPAPAVAAAAAVATAPVATTAVTAAANAPVASPTGTPADPVAADEAADDAYWSQQPAAVQQLRNIQDPAQREALGDELANNGYSIDVPIMVWGWDPAKTMQARESYGYTWVPSALEAQVGAAPGISAGPSVTPYDPNHPPSGSIQVQVPSAA